MNRLRTGKAPATKDDRDFVLDRYVSKLERPPAVFGLEQSYPVKGWGMLGNDDWGDCALAGPAHETMMLAAAAGAPVRFTTENVLSDYSAVTGFDEADGPPGDNPTDQGSNVRQVLAYRRSKGLLDASGERHKIGAFIKLKPTLEHLYNALYLFGTVGIGLRFPNSAMEQFDRGEIWTPVAGEAEPDEGHYVCLVAKRKHLEVVTWGQIQQLTLGFLKEYCDEAWTYLTPEMVEEGKAPTGFDEKLLQEDLAAL